MAENENIEAQLGLVDLDADQLRAVAGGENVITYHCKKCGATEFVKKFDLTPQGKVWDWWECASCGQYYTDYTKECQYFVSGGF